MIKARLFFSVAHNYTNITEDKVAELGAGAFQLGKSESVSISDIICY